MNRSGLGARFRRLWVATGVSAVGDGMVLVGFPLLALQFTHQPLLIAAVVACGQAPAVLVGLPAGVMADRMNQRRLLLFIELARFVVLGGFAVALLAGVESLPLLYVSVFVLGGLSVFFDVVASASLPSVVAESDLVAANTQLLSVELTGEELVGQAAGGAAFAVARSVPFVADAISFVLSALLIRGAVADVEREPAPVSAWRDMRQGLKWFVGEPVLRLLTGVIATLAFCQAAVLGVLVLYATTHLHLRGAGYGFLLAVAAAGNLVAVPVAPRIHRWLGTAGCITTSGVVAAVAYPALAITHSPVVAGAALMVETVAVLVGNVAARSLRQAVVPASMQGRAAAAVQTVVLVCVPLGGLAGGLATAGVGIRDAFLGAGALQLLLVIAVAPRLRSRLGGMDGAYSPGDATSPAPEGGAAATRAA